MFAFPFHDTSLRKSIETFWRSLYGLLDLQGKVPAGLSEKKEWSPGVNLLCDLSSHIAKWDKNIIVENLPGRAHFAAELWTDGKSREKVVVVMEKKCLGKYAVAFFIPVPSGQDFSAAAEEAMGRIVTLYKLVESSEEGFRLAA